MPDIRLPNGTIMRGVPENASKDEVKRRAIASGAITEAEFSSGPAPIPQQDEWRAFNKPPAQPEKPVVEDRVAGPSVPSTTSMEPYKELNAAQKVQAEVMGRVRAAGKLQGDFLQEAQNVAIGGFQEPVLQMGYDIKNLIVGAISGPVGQETKDEQQQRIASFLSMMGQSMSIVSQGKTEVTFNERGEATSSKPETFVGMVTPYLVPVTEGFKFVQGMTALAKTTPTVRNAVAAIVSGTVVDQVLTDPYADNVADVIQDLFPDNEAAQSTFIDFLSTEEDDSETTRRLKMMGQDLILTGAMGTIGTLIGVARRSKDPILQKFLTKDPSEFTPEEAGEMALALAKQIKNDAKAVVRPKMSESGKPIYRNGSPVYEPVMKDGKPVVRTYAQSAAEVLVEEGEAAIRQVEAQAGGGTSPWLRRLYQQIGTSRGYFTENGFHLKNTSENEKRATMHRAETLSRRLNSTVESIAFSAQGISPEASAEVIQRNLTRALTDPTGRALNLLPEELRGDVRYARTMIDDLTRQLIDSPTVFSEFKEGISENIGSYLKRSYELIENPRYVPEQTHRLAATRYIADELVEADPSLSIEKATEFATARVEVILRDKASDYINFMGNSSRVNRSIYKAKEDIPEPIRKLMGEITNPADNILLTVKRMTDFVENDKFYRNFYDLGKGKYIFDQPQGIYTYPIKETGSFLDVADPASFAGRSIAGREGKYTTKEIALALVNKESQWVDPSSNTWMAGVMRGFTTVKGTTQAAKTVYSHSVHAVNFLGGATARLANGSIPFGKESLDAFRVVAEQVKLGGDKSISDITERYLRLGIINTSTTAREMNALIETGLGDPDSVAKWLTEQAAKGGSGTERVVGAIAEGAPRVYVGTDDFFKISEFESELATLRRAYPDKSVSELEQIAARTVKNTMFNYDMVPKGIQRLRNLPLGNFVGFPAEVARTSVNIIQQGFDEVVSGNAVLRARGIKRLTGITAVAGSGLSYPSILSMRQAGYDNEEQQKALQMVARTPWSQYPTPLIIRGDDGTLYIADASRLDAYSYFREPFNALMNKILENTAKDQDITQFIDEAFNPFVEGSVTQTILAPFLSQSMTTEAVTEIWSAMMSEDGRSTSGKPLFTPGMPTGDKVGAMMNLLWDLAAPGSVTTFQRMYGAATGELDRWTGEPMNMDSEALSNIGLRFKKLDIPQFVEYSAGDYVSRAKDMINIPVDYQTSPKKVVEYYDSINQERYKLQQDLHEQVQAAIVLGMPTAEILSVLDGRGVSEREAYNIVSGRFTPLSITSGMDTKFLERVAYGEGVSSSTGSRILKRDLINRYNLMYGNSLIRFNDEGDKPSGVRLLKAGGGAVAKGILKMFGKEAAKEAAPVVVKEVAKEAAPEAVVNGMSPEWFAGLAKFGVEGMTTPARMARSVEQGWSADDFYHGTAYSFDEFDTKKLGSLTKADSAREGFFFSRSPRTSGDYAKMADTPKNTPELESKSSAGPNIVPVKLKYSNPKIVEMNYTTYSDFNRPKLGEEIRKAKEEGHDAVIFKNFSDRVLPEDAGQNIYRWEYLFNDLKEKRPELLKKIIPDYKGGKMPEGFIPDPDVYSPKNELPNEVWKEWEDFYETSNRRWHREEMGDDFTDQIVVFKPEQIRSVNATFDPEESASGRLLKAIGGVVDVPQAPAKPAERIDKLTGLPYDLQAGGSFVEEDPLRRMLMACGGIVRRSR